MINQIRSFLLEHGIAIRQGLPDILAKRSDVLSPRMIRIIEDLSGDDKGAIVFGKRSLATGSQPGSPMCRGA